MLWSALSLSGKLRSVIVVSGIKLSGTYSVHGIWIYGTSTSIPFTKYYDKMISRDNFMAGITIIIIQIAHAYLDIVHSFVSLVRRSCLTLLLGVTSLFNVI